MNKALSFSKILCSQYKMPVGRLMDVFLLPLIINWSSFKIYVLVPTTGKVAVEAKYAKQRQ